MTISSDTETVRSLRAENEALRATLEVLMDRVEQSAPTDGSVHAVFERNLALHQLVEERTRELARINEGLMREAAERRRVEKQLRETVEEARKLALVARYTDNAVIITDADFRIEWVNEGFERLTEYRRDEVRGRTPGELLHGPETDAGQVRRMMGCVARGEGFNGELVNYARSGRSYWIEIEVRPIYGDDGRIRNFVSIESDITARKRAEAQLAQAQKLESIGQLAAGIAHEINTPTQYVGDNTRFLKESFGDLLAVLDACVEWLDPAGEERAWQERSGEVRAMLEELDIGFLRDEIPKAIDESLEGLERVSTIVRAMKDFSHPGSEDAAPADLNAAIRSTATVCRNRWKYVAELVMDLEPDLPPLPCRIAEINQVVLNLIVNAADAIAETFGEGTEAKGRVEVSTRHAGGWVEIRVVDNGPGIPEEARGRIFDPFFTTKEVGKGTGQGLAICHSAVQKHGGTISFETDLGRGTTFVVRLPLRGSEAEELREAA